MNCPRCKKGIDQVNIISECWQKADLKGNKIEDYNSIEEILETKKVECPECFEDIADSIEL